MDFCFYRRWRKKRLISKSFNFCVWARKIQAGQLLCKGAYHLRYVTEHSKQYCAAFFRRKSIGYCDRAFFIKQ